jgi:hypothetical protein
MTLLEDEHRRSQRAQRKHDKHQSRRKRRRAKQRRPSSLDQPLSMLLDSQCLSFFEWCQCRFSERTDRRILKSGRGPRVVQLSTQRIGITVEANRAWQQSRERTS